MKIDIQRESGESRWFRQTLHLASSESGGEFLKLSPVAAGPKHPVLKFAAAVSKRGWPLPASVRCFKERAFLEEPERKHKKMQRGRRENYFETR